VGWKMGRKTTRGKHWASELTLVCWSRKESLGPGNPRNQRSRTVGEIRYVPSCRTDLKELRVWQTLKGRQRDEGGEEARVIPRVSGHWQVPSDCEKTGGKTKSQFFECIQKTLRE
jgi:hypothetical protein